MQLLALLLATYFALTPVQSPYAGLPTVLVDIAQCESGMAQYKPDGELVRDYATGTHVGVYQISEGWAQFAQDRGVDIYTAQGNISFAVYLYNRFGTQPWLASKSCWNKHVLADRSS